MTQTSDGHTTLKVALATTELAVGGAERCLVNLALGLDRSRFRPMVYSLAPAPGDERADLVRQLLSADVPVKFVGVRSRWRFFTAVRRLSQMLREQAPDVLQTFLFHANTVGAISAGRAGVPRTVTGIRVSDPRRWRHAVERRLSATVHRMVCVSEDVKQFSMIQAGLPAEKLVVIPNGLDVTRYESASPAELTPLGIKPDRSVIVGIGRLDRQKGFDWLLDLAPRFLDALPQHDVLLVGEGPERAALSDRLRQRKLQGRVYFAGWRTDIAEILRRSALLVLPSRWEGMPNVLLEAMASGLPVVAARVEGVEEILGTLAKDQVVSIGDEDAFVRQVVELSLASVEQRKTIARQNQERIRQRFSLSAMVRAYEELYEAVAGKG